MAENQFKIGATLEVNDNQIKTEFTKAGELAGESVAQGLEKKGGDIEQRMSEQVDNLRGKLEDLSNFDWELNLNTDNAQEYINILGGEITEANQKLFEFQDELNATGESGGQAFTKLQTETQDFASTLIEAREQLKEYADSSKTGFDDLKDSVDKTTEAVEKLNDTAEQSASESRGVGKLIKFLGSARIMNFFYNNLNKIGQKLIELSGDSERLTEKWDGVLAKFEAVGGYIGKALVPAVDSAIDEISNMSDELIKTGQDGSSAVGIIQKAVYILGQAFVGIIKIIKQVGQFIGTFFADLYVERTALGQDIFDSTKSIIENIGNADNWIALGNNIKYGIIKGVNAAIGSLNKLSEWMNKKLGINLGQIDTFDAGQKQSYTWNVDFSRTKNALKEVRDNTIDFAKELGNEWANFWKDAKQGYEDLGKTTVETNKKISEDTKKKITGGGGGSKKDSVKGAYEELEEAAQDIWSEMTSLVEEHQKSYDKLTEEIEKVGEQYDKLRDEAKKTWEEAEKALSNYNDELEKAQGEAITDLGQRYVELQKDLMGVDEWMKKEARSLSWEYIRELQEAGYSEYGGYDLKKLIELKEKLDEIQLIEENTTEEQRKSEEFIKETSKTQEILNKLKEEEAEIEEKKASAMEKQAIAQAMMNQQDGQQYIKTLTKNGEEIGTYYWDTVKKSWEKIHDADNIEYAKQLEDQSENLNNQLAQYQQEKNEEVEILIDTTARKIQLENEFQKVFEENAKKQEKELENIISLTDKLIEKKKEYLSLGGTLHNAYGGSVLSGMASIVGENGPEQIIARQSSYIQPRNAGNSYNTVNNSNNLSINGLELGSFNTIDDMLDALKERLTYRS